MEIKVKQGIKVTHQISVLDKDGKLVRKLPPIDNMITEHGLDRLATVGLHEMSQHMYLGSDTDRDGSVGATRTVSINDVTSGVVTSSVSLFYNPKDIGRSMVFLDGTRAEITAVNSSSELVIDNTTLSISSTENAKIENIAIDTLGTLIDESGATETSSVSDWNGTFVHFDAYGYSVVHRRICISNPFETEQTVTEVGLYDQALGANPTKNVLALLSLEGNAQVTVPAGGVFVDHTAISSNVSRVVQDFTSSNITNLTGNAKIKFCVSDFVTSGNRVTTNQLISRLDSSGDPQTYAPDNTSFWTHETRSTQNISPVSTKDRVFIGTYDDGGGDLSVFPSTLATNQRFVSSVDGDANTNRSNSTTATFSKANADTVPGDINIIGLCESDNLHVAIRLDDAIPFTYSDSSLTLTFTKTWDRV